ncbi:MAG: diacylglycerol kinase family protein [Candidatus Sulfotelmatobacter sp.]
MRAAAILGLGCSPKKLKPFQSNKSIDWLVGMPGLDDQADVILLFGGDGTMHRHLGQLVRLGLPVLVVPAGSGNDFARALGLRRVRDSLAAWEKFCGGANNLRATDLGLIAPLESAGVAPHSTAPLTSRYFCCVAGVGLDGAVSQRANRLPRWLRGHGGYVLSLAPTIFTFAPLPMRVLTPAEDNAAWSARSDQLTILAAFANTPVYGGGMKVAPRAKMDDGLLDVCIVGSVGPFKLFCMFPTVYFGRHLSIREVQYFHAGRVRVETEHPLDVYADGEFVCRTPIEVGVQRAALKLVTP